LRNRKEVSRGLVIPERKGDTVMTVGVKTKSVQGKRGIGGASEGGALRSGRLGDL